MDVNCAVSKERGWSGRDLRQQMAGFVMTLVVYPLLALWTLTGIGFFPLGFLLWKLVTGWPAGRIMRHFIWLYGRGWMAIVSPFVRFRRQGFENLHDLRPSVFVLNHLSFFDTYCMALLPCYDVTFAVRAWPFRMFWYGAFMRLAGYLNVEDSSWEGVLQQADQALSAGSHLLFFPEGHRSRDGGLQPFQSGAFRLALAKKVPLVPLCITGTDRLLPPGRWRFSPCRITLQALPPIDPAAYSGEKDYRLLLRQVREQMAATLKQMNAK
jgi:1-acyl-sn-glycerol-3-phosphate acyltransferase